MKENRLIYIFAKLNKLFFLEEEKKIRKIEYSLWFYQEKRCFSEYENTGGTTDRHLQSSKN